MKPPADVDSRFAPVVAAFARDRAVSYAGKGFGSAALKVGGKIFAMLTSKERFVVKLPASRIEELVRTGEGERFQLGHRRLMREWVALHSPPPSWPAFAREARAFVGTSPRPEARRPAPRRTRRHTTAR